MFWRIERNVHVRQSPLFSVTSDRGVVQQASLDDGIYRVLQIGLLVEYIRGDIVTIAMRMWQGVSARSSISSAL